MFKKLANNSFQTGLPKAEHLHAERNPASLTQSVQYRGTSSIAMLAITGLETSLPSVVIWQSKEFAAVPTEFSRNMAGPQILDHMRKDNG